MRALCFVALRIIRSLNPEGGGPMEEVRQITPYLSALGVESTVVSLDSLTSPFCRSVVCGRWPGSVAGNYGYRRALPSIHNLAKDHDAVIIHGIWQYHAYATWRPCAAPVFPTFTPMGCWIPGSSTPIRSSILRSGHWPWADYRVLRDAKAVLFTTEQERLLARRRLVV